MVEKNQLLEEQALNTLQTMQRIDEELETLMVKTVEDLRKPLAFLVEVTQNILRCREIENKAFEKLNNIIQ